MLNGLFFTTEVMKKKIKYKCLNEMKCLVYTVLYWILRQQNFLKQFFLFLYYCGGELIQTLNLFEVIQNMKTKEMKNQTRWFLKILFQYTRKGAASITCVY